MSECVCASLRELRLPINGKCLYLEISPEERRILPTEVIEERQPTVDFDYLCA